MREETTPESGTLTALAAASEPPEDPRERAAFYWTRANHFARRAVEDAWRCGQALNEAKAALPHGAWHPWLESRAIARRTATRWMELAREIEIGQIGRFESVEAALKSVDKWRLDEYAARARFALEQDLAELRGGAPISVAPQDRAGDDGAADDRTAKRGNYTTGAQPPARSWRATERMRLGALSGGGTRARERLSLPRRKASNDIFEDAANQVGDRGNRGPVSGWLHVRRS